MERRVFIKSSCAGAISALTMMESQAFAASSRLPPTIIRDDVHSFPSLASFEPPPVIQKCDAVRDMMRAYASSSRILLGDRQVLSNLRQAAGKLYRAELAQAEKELKKLIAIYPKEKLASRRAQISHRAWALIVKIGTFVLLKAVEVAVKSTPHGALLFTAAVAIEATYDFGMQIIETPANGSDAGKILYNFASARNADFDLLATASKDKQLGKITKGTGQLLDIVEVGILFYNGVSIASDFWEVKQIDAHFEGLKYKHNEMKKTLAELFGKNGPDPEADDRFLTLMLEQHEQLSDTLEQLYISSSYSSCQTLPVKGLSKFVSENYGAPYSLIVSDLP